MAKQDAFKLSVELKLCHVCKNQHLLSSGPNPFLNPPCSTCISNDTKLNFKEMSKND